jgi:hypothetical protein
VSDESAHSDISQSVTVKAVIFKGTHFRDFLTKYMFVGSYSCGCYMSAI